ncbi:MAG: S1C family serine protease, partial [Nitrospinales bacterium]
MNKIAFLLLALVMLGSFLVSKRTAEVSQSPVIQETSSETDALFQTQGYKDILELQAAFVRNAKRIKPSVVSINNLKEITDKKHRPSAFNNSSSVWSFNLRDFLKNIGRKRYLAKSVGSGILLKDNGYILTNYHVLENTKRLMVRLSDGREYRANIVGKDPKTDVALSKILSFRNFPEPSFGKSESLGVGEWVMAIGNPYGLEGTVTVGVVSAVGRTDLGIATYENFIQTDASINPGNSGGPLINLEGEIVGINTAVAAIGAGVGFAIPIEMAIRISDELIENGKVERGWLGVGIQTLTP